MDAANVPLFGCPDAQLEQTYYFRWWTYRKHIRRTPNGLVLTEFLQPVSHAGPYNTISCAFGHHLAEGRWLRDRRPLDEYTHFWFRSGSDGGPAEHFHKYSSWAAAAIYERYLVTLDRDFLVDLLDDLVADYERWETERQRPMGCFGNTTCGTAWRNRSPAAAWPKTSGPRSTATWRPMPAAIAQIAELAGRREIGRSSSTPSQKRCARR